MLEQSRIRLEDNQYVLSVETFADHPVYAVTWYGAAAFCQAQGGRLPTEAEWEYAASFNPASGEKQKYPWGNSFDPTAANFCDQECGFSHADTAHNDGFARTSPVGSFENGRSPQGAYDLGGNVWEWVGDFYNATYYTRSAETNPQGPDTGSQHVVRGGSWFDSGNFLNAVFRTGIPPLEPDDTVGFRCAYDELPTR